MNAQRFVRGLMLGLSTIIASTISVAAIAASSDHDLLKGYCDGASTQYALNECASKAADGVDLELNAAYQAVLKKWQNYPAVVSQLRASQRAWLSYRDADVTSRFAYENLDASNRGTILPFAELVYRMSLEHERSERLCLYLRGLAEGEVERSPCAELVKHPRIIPAPTH